ncbi:hypothetical protein [Luteimonas sp. MC1828]|uniref:hypothetical protein n=1 Tax=Luteimonas sp. MC1828 TaxID=2799787 RepID=UPI0018F12287|nr:hypothetical protein [Luteimonas sp. MC1828]MBJ7575675.1 hypothetical protein [Luteimonas sp. MC1828]
MIAADANRKWLERARWCHRQADEAERDLQPRGVDEPKSMTELAVDFWRGMALTILESLEK